MTATLKSLIKDTSLFRKLYIIDLFFCNIYFLQIAAYTFLVPLFIWGVYLFVLNQKRYGTFFRMRFGVWAAAFALFSIVAMIFNYNCMILYSIVMLLHVCICFFVFYGMHTEPGFRFREELYSICRMMVYLTTVFNILGLIGLMFGFKYESGYIKMIIYENRFTGLYVNPNLLGFISVVTIICCHMLYKEKMLESVSQPRISKIWMTACVATNLFSLILCDSNASLVLALAYAIAYLVYVFFADKAGLSAGKIIVKIVSLVLVGSFLIVFSLMFRSIFQTGFAVITSKTSSFAELLFNDVDIPPEVIEDDQENIVTFEHENTNVDSGRIRLWKESAELFGMSPIIGISSGNIVYYSQEYLNGVLNYSYHKNDLHNGLITILVSTGIIGFLLFVIFGFRFAKHAAQHLFLQKKTYRNDVYPCLFCFLCAYMFYAFFEKALLYDISFLVLWFWLMMGYTSCFIRQNERKLEKIRVTDKWRINRSMI